jgi:DNA replication protein DnaC
MENQIFQDLKGLHLSGMAECWQRLQETRKHQEIVLQDGLLMLIQAEHDQRAANKTARLIKNARFRYDASIEQLVFDPAKGRDQGRIMQLASCEYIRQGASVLITGPAGVGKSFLATALGYQGCLSGYRVRYFNMSKLLEAMQMARIEAKAAKFFDRMAEVDLLIIEDFGIKVLDGQQLLDFMELIEDRHARKSTIITSQLPVKNWYDVLAKNTTVADAVLDRLAKTAHRFELTGDSMRK